MADHLIDQIHVLVVQLLSQADSWCDCGCMDEVREGLEWIQVEIERRAGDVCRCF